MGGPKKRLRPLSVSLVVIKSMNNLVTICIYPTLKIVSKIRPKMFLISNSVAPFFVASLPRRPRLIDKKIDTPPGALKNFIKLSPTLSSLF